MRNRRPALLLLTLSVGCGAAPAPNTAPPPDSPLEIVAESPRRWTGIAVNDDGTLVVNYPRWSDDVPISVAVLDAQRAPTPFPNAEWNAWHPGRDPATHWVCVQSVVFDRDDRLWVLDPGNPRFEGVVPGAPKLVRFDSLDDDTPAQVIALAPPVISEQSYVNDVRFDLDRHHAYLTDSGDGALIVIDLESGNARRVLDSHPSTHAEPITLRIGGQPFEREVHADGIALDASEGWLYYQALRGRTLYRIPTAALRDPGATDETLAGAIEELGEVGASDGLEFRDGRVWLTSLEHDAIRTFRPGEGLPTTIAQDPRLAWPDSFAITDDGTVYFTTAQIHLGDAPPDPFRIWRLRPAR